MSSTHHPDLACRPRARRRVARLIPLLAALLLAACATPPGPRALAASASAPAAINAGVQKSFAPGQRPFAEVVRGFEKTPGWRTVWHKDERFLLELKPADFEQPFFFTTQRNQGIGERWLWSGMMLESGIGQFVRLSDRVQWLEKNVRFAARGNNALQHAVASAFSDSLRGSAPILSQPDPATGAILVDLNALVLTDFSGSAARLQSTFRQPYQFDRANSRILRSYAGSPESAPEPARESAQESVIEMQAHYTAPGLGAPGQTSGATVPANLPDARSLFMGFTLSFSALPDEMPARAADPRVGYFHTTRYNFAREAAVSPREYIIHRWRLVKQDPAARLSPPVAPITFWLDRNIPLPYRDTVRDAILTWNAAFERIGFKDAIVVRQQPDDATWRSGSRQHATVQWYLGTDNTAALGPSLVDPRSGEILDADIIIDDHRLRQARRNAQYRLPTGAAAAHAHAHAGEDCEFADDAYAELGQVLDIAITRDGLAADSAEIDRMVRDTLYAVVMHEVGHTLGLRHNFRASAAYTPAQLADPAFVAEHGLAASVMDYLPVNTPLRNEAPVALTQKTLGPYDYWAIEYGYTPLPPESEARALSAIAARANSDPLLAWGDDSEAGAADGNLLNAGVDPEVARNDLGNDPLAWFERRLKLTHELWQALAARPAPRSADENGATREAVMRSLSLLAAAAGNAARNIGGVHFSRTPGAQQADNFQPVPAAVQRKTLAMLSQGLFRPDSFALAPELLRRLPPATLDGIQADPLLPLVSFIQRTQERVLDLLFSERLSARLLESSLLTDKTFSLAELHAGLRRDIWRELERDGDIPLLRRNLQRAYLTRLSQLILQGAKAPADARAIARSEAVTLQNSLRHALQRPGRSLEARAHLLDARATLDETLKAPLLRQTP